MELQTIFEEQIELDKSYVLPISKLVLINCITFSSLTQTAKHYIATLIE
jgi:hypothetical protein